MSKQDGRIFRCEVCGDDDTCTKDEHVCQQCVTHAAIGRAVERLPECGTLQKNPDGSWNCWGWDMEADPHHGPTPLDALKKAGLCDEEGEK